MTCGDAPTVASCADFRLVASAPERPSKDFVGALCHARGLCGEQATGFGDDCKDDEGRVGAHLQSGPSVPRAPAPNLVLVETDEALCELETLLDAAPLPRNPHQGAHQCGPGVWHEVLGELARGVVAGHQQRRLTA